MRFVKLLVPCQLICGSEAIDFLHCPRAKDDYHFAKLLPSINQWHISLILCFHSWQ